MAWTEIYEWNHIVIAKVEQCYSCCHGNKVSGWQIFGYFKLHWSYWISFNLSNFVGLYPKGPYLGLEKETENFCIVSTYSIKRAREKNGNGRLRNVQKSFMHVQSCCFRCCFACLNLLLFSRSRCHRRRRCFRYLLLWSWYFYCHGKLTSLSSLLYSFQNLLSLIIVNLRNRTGEERTRQTLRDRCDTNFVWNNFSPNFTLFCKGPDNFAVKKRSRQNTQVIALSRLSHTSVLPSSSPCPPVA